MSRSTFLATALVLIASSSFAQTMQLEGEAPQLQMTPWRDDASPRVGEVPHDFQGGQEQDPHLGEPEAITAEMTLGSEWTAAATITTLQGAEPDSSVAAVLEPGTRVQFEGVENGFVRVRPLEGPAEGQVSYIPEGIATSFLHRMIDSGVEAAISKLRDTVDMMQNDPQFRITNIKLILAVPPSVEVDLELRSPEVSTR